MIAAALAALALAAGAHDPVFTARANAACFKWEDMLVNPPGDVGGGDLGDPKYDAAWLRVFDRYSVVLRRLQPANAADRRQWKLVLAQLPAIRSDEIALAKAVERRAAKATIVRALLALQKPWSAAHRHAVAAGARQCFSDD